MLDLHRSLQNTSWRRALNIEREKSRRVVRHGICPFSQASRRLRAPLYDPASTQRRQRNPVRPSYPSPCFGPRLPCSLVVQVTRRRVSFAVAAALVVWLLLQSFPLRVRWLAMDALLSFLARVLVLLLSMCCSTAACLRPTDLPLSPSALCFTDRGRWTVEASKGCLVILVCSRFFENHSKINIRSNDLKLVLLDLSYDALHLKNMNAHATILCFYL